MRHMIAGIAAMAFMVSIMAVAEEAARPKFEVGAKYYSESSGFAVSKVADGV